MPKHGTIIAPWSKSRSTKMHRNKSAEHLLLLHIKLFKKTKTEDYPCLVFCMNFAFCMNFLHEFCYILLINWPDFIVIIRCPVYDVKNFENNLKFPIKLLIWNKKSIFHHFKGLRPESEPFIKSRILWVFIIKGIIFEIRVLTSEERP